MITTPAIANMIRSNEVNKIPDTIQTSRHLGMFTLDDHLIRLCESGRIERADALAFSQDTATVADRLTAVRARSDSPAFG